MPKLLRSFTSASPSSAKQPLSILAEYQKHLTMCQCRDDIHDRLMFWIKSMTELPKLFELAIKVKSVLVTSAPVERVFGHGGIIMRPYIWLASMIRCYQILWSHPLTEMKLLLTLNSQAAKCFLLCTYFAENVITNISKTCFWLII